MDKKYVFIAGLYTIEHNMSPHRRTVIKTATLGIFGFGAGCIRSPTQRNPTTSLATETPIPTEKATLKPKSTPLPPESFDRNDVLAYVKAYERAVLYNALYKPDATKIEVSCTSTLAQQTDHGTYVVAVCGGYAKYDNAVADLGATPTAYFVNDTQTIRITNSDIDWYSLGESYRSADRSENLPATSTVTRLRLYNFDMTPHTMTVTVTYLGDTTTNRVLSEEFRLTVGAGQVVSNLARRRGEYRVEVILDTGETARHQWILSESHSRFTTAIYITPIGTLLVGEWPDSLR